MSEEETTKVKDLSQVSMIRAIARATDHFTDRLKGILKEEGLTVGEFDVIAALGNTDGLRMSDIARVMLLSSSPSNATRVCSALEKRGLVQRQRSPDNDREVIARLTPAGQAKFDESFLRVVRAHVAFVDATLTEDEQREAARLMRKFVGATG